MTTVSGGDLPLFTNTKLAAVPSSTWTNPAYRAAAAAMAMTIVARRPP